MNHDCTKKETIVCEQAPKPVGPYSAAVATGCLVFVSGQLGIDPATGSIVEGGVEAEARQVLKNVKTLLEAAGSGMEHVVKATVFLTDIQDFAKVNAIYAEFFTANYPARSAFEVGALPKGGLVEVEAIAVRPAKDEKDCCH